MDFVSDGLAYGRHFRCLNVVDNYTRECLATEVDTSLPGQRVKLVLERLREMRGLPGPVTVDKGPEFAGQVLDAWAYEVGVTLSFIRPVRPAENACIESFNGRFRDECLNENWFVSMRHAKRLIEDWRIEYNTERPHSSLGYPLTRSFESYLFSVMSEVDGRKVAVFRCSWNCTEGADRLDGKNAAAPRMGHIDPQQTSGTSKHQWLFAKCTGRSLGHVC